MTLEWIITLVLNIIIVTSFLFTTCVWSILQLCGRMAMLEYVTSITLMWPFSFLQCSHQVTLDQAAHLMDAVALGTPLHWLELIMLLSLVKGEGGREGEGYWNVSCDSRVQSMVIVNNVSTMLNAVWRIKWHRPIWNTLTKSYCPQQSYYFQFMTSSASFVLRIPYVGHIPGGWTAVKEELAQKYFEGGYPEMAAMIKI